MKLFNSFTEFILFLKYIFIEFTSFLHCVYLSYRAICFNFENIAHLSFIQ